MSKGLGYNDIWQNNKVHKYVCATGMKKGAPETHVLLINIYKCEMINISSNPLSQAAKYTWHGTVVGNVQGSPAEFPQRFHLPTSMTADNCVLIFKSTAALPVLWKDKPA